MKVRKGKNNISTNIYLKENKNIPTNLICNKFDIHEEIFSYIYNYNSVIYHSGDFNLLDLRDKLAEFLKKLNTYNSFSEDYYFNYLFKENIIDIISYYKVKFFHFDKRFEPILDIFINNLEKSNNLSNILQITIETFDSIIKYCETEDNLEEYGNLPYYK